MRIDEQYMKRCLELADRGKGFVEPNPTVGCVIVYEGRIIGEGYHEKYGGPHAEVNAINSVAESDRHLLSESTLYVSLEPCAHFGKTPPCADFIIKNKIPQVVFLKYDTNPLVFGKGIQKLLDAGISVRQHRPYIILKWAQSADGFMASNGPVQVWLTGESARAVVHQWRAEEDAILVGTRTVEIDDPELTVRLVDGKNPTRVVIDRELTLAPLRKIFCPTATVLVYNQSESVVTENVHRIKIDFTKNVLEQILSDLYSRNIHSLIVEGGANTLARFVSTGLWDETRIFTAPEALGNGKKSPEIKGVLVSEVLVGKDTLSIYSKST